VLSRTWTRALLLMTWHVEVPMMASIWPGRVTCAAGAVTCASTLPEGAWRRWDSEEDFLFFETMRRMLPRSHPPTATAMPSRSPVHSA